ncbi:hypothetical protein [Thalassospira xiamenensis]|nr:hypothetical protein [Thalassospira xiamenensis]
MQFLDFGIGGNMEWLKNIAINLNAKGPAAVLIALIVSISSLGLWGEGELAATALGILAFALGLLGLALANRA